MSWPAHAGHPVAVCIPESPRPRLQWLLDHPHARAMTGGRLFRRRLRVGRREGGFHFAPDFYRKIVAIVFDVGPAQRLPRRDLALELDVVRQAQRQESSLERALGRALLAPDAIAALAIEDLAALELALCGRDHVGAESRGGSGRLAPQCNRGDRDAEQ